MYTIFLLHIISLWNFKKWIGDFEDDRNMNLYIFSVRLTTKIVCNMTLHKRYTPSFHERYSMELMLTYRVHENY